MKSMKSTKNKIFSFVRRTKDIKKRFFADPSELEENKQPTFTSYFLKFFQAMTLWENATLWIETLPGLISYTQCSSIVLYFSKYPKTIHRNKKSRLKNIEQVYTVVLQACNYLIKMNVTFMLETFFRVNQEHQHIKVNQYESITNDLENIHFVEGLNKIIRAQPKTKTEKTFFVIKKAVEYIRADSDSKIMELTLLNKQSQKKLFKKVVKQFLKMPITNKKMRILIWNKIAKEGTLSKNLISITQSQSGSIEFPCG
jgi:hypothetical protein